MASAIFLLVLSVGMIAAGWGYVKAARRMRAFETTRGTVIGRDVATLTGGYREGRWGRGGNYRPLVIYTYEVGGVAYTSDRWSYAARGFKRSVVEQQLAALPEELDVYYNPATPQEAYLEKHSPTIGNGLVAAGAVGVLIAVLLLVA